MQIQTWIDQRELRLAEDLQRDADTIADEQEKRFEAMNHLAALEATKASTPLRRSSDGE